MKLHQIKPELLKRQMTKIEENKEFVANLRSERGESRSTDLYSTFNTFPDDMLKFQKQGRWRDDPRRVSEAEQKVLLSNYAIETSDMTALMGDPRLLRLAKIKLQNKELKDEELAK